MCIRDSFLPGISKTTFLCDGVYIEYTALDEAAVTRLIQMLQNMGIRFILTDDADNSNPVTRANKGMPDKQLWEIPLADFVASEAVSYTHLAVYKRQPQYTCVHTWGIWTESNNYRCMAGYWPELADAGDVCRKPFKCQSAEY